MISDKRSSSKPFHFLRSPWHLSLASSKRRTTWQRSSCTAPRYDLFLLACCFSSCRVEMFFHLDSCLSKALWEFVPGVRVLDVCLYEAHTNQSWPHIGWSKHLFFVWHLHRWPVELTVWNENVTALCSNNKCLIWAFSLLAHDQWSSVIFNLFNWYKTCKNTIYSRMLLCQHISPRKTIKCCFYTLAFIWIKQRRYKAMREFQSCCFPLFYASQNFIF